MFSLYLSHCFFVILYYTCFKYTNKIQLLFKTKKKVEIELFHIKHAFFQHVYFHIKYTLLPAP
jgi:hypothetical protein